MRRLCIFALSILLLCVMTACGGSSALHTGVLYADFSCGSAEAEFIKEYPFEYTGRLKTASELADELSKLTGLDFKITAKTSDDRLIVDWAADSTLIGGLDDRELKEDFFFHDINTLQWFMLDSLWRTLSDNLDVKAVYYTMNGGQELVIEELAPVNAFTLEVPFMGSGFYFAHSDNRGDEGGGPYLRTRGLWRFDGKKSGVSIEMDGMGAFTIHSADGASSELGYLDYVDEYSDGSLRYDMYEMDGNLIGGFYFDSDTQIHMGNVDGEVYLLEESTVEDYAPNTYYDEDHGLLLSYPQVFSSEGTLLKDGKMDFYTLWDTGMDFWVTPNEDGLSAAEYVASMKLTESMELADGVVIGYGEGEDSLGRKASIAIYYMIEKDIAAQVEILCSESEEASYWYKRLQRGAVSITKAYVDNTVG